MACPAISSRSDWQTHADFIQVLMVAPTHLCHLLLPGMRERGYGRIVNVASLAGLIPGTPGHTLYAAAKSYLIKFSQSLALENRDAGVNVCALCPGFTYSEFHDVTGARESVEDAGVDVVARRRRGAGRTGCRRARRYRLHPGTDQPRHQGADQAAAGHVCITHDAEALTPFSRQFGRLTNDSANPRPVKDLTVLFSPELR